MAIKYLSHLETLNIDMQGYELQNAVVHNVTATSKPASPGVGQIIYNSTDEALEVWDGSAFKSPITCAPFEYLNDIIYLHFN